MKTKIKDIKIAFYYNWTPLVYPYNKKYIDELVFLEKDEYIPYYNETFDFIVKNKNYPTFVFLYTVHTDTAGHKYGWMSEKYINSIEEADIHIGELIDKIKEKDLYEDTHFLFLTDHGGIKKSHGGVTPNEMIVPWSINGPKIKKGLEMTSFNNTINTAPVILKLFKVKQPSSWIGRIPDEVFK